MYKHDQILFTNSDDELLYRVHHLKIIANKFHGKISYKTKPIACRDKTLVPNKICVGNSTVQQVNSFNTWAKLCLTQKRVICR
jgi:hypothetical protein